MTELGEALGSRRNERRLAQLVAGAALLLAGSTAFALGLGHAAADALAAAGLGDRGATRGGLAIGGLVVPAAFAVLRARLPAQRGRGWLLPGAGFVGVATLGLLVAAPSGSPADPVSWAVGATYLIGVTLVVSSFLATAVESTASDDRPQVSYRRSTSRHDGPVPADGGTDEDDDLSFPLDEE